MRRALFDLTGAFSQGSDRLADLEATLPDWDPIDLPDVVAESWKQDFSMPERHDPSRFCYLVHGLGGSARRALQMSFIFERTAEIDHSQDFDLLESPLQISRKKLVSCSVIDQDHVATFGGVGLILRASVKNIIKAHHEDLGTYFPNPSKVVTSSFRVLETVPSLLNRSPENSWNEVVLTGTTDEGKLSVVGFWIKLDDDGNLEDPTNTPRIIQLANRYKLPLIRIQRKPTIFLDKVKYNSLPGNLYSFALHESGLRFSISHIAGFNFTVVDSRLKSRMMTEDEFENMIKKLELSLDEGGRLLLLTHLNEIRTQFGIRV